MEAGRLHRPPATTKRLKTTYLYRPATERENSPRILLTVQIEGVQTTAFVDTGGVNLLCAPEIAARAGIDPTGGIPSEPLLWRSHRVHGTLHRVALTLLAAEGESVNIEATAFIPQSNDEWAESFPCILGMHGCLERLRFAVDPNNDTFYFGQLSES